MQSQNHNGTQKRVKYFIGGLLILAAVVYLIFSSTRATAEYFMTVDELRAGDETLVDQNVRISGAVVGDTIQYNPETLDLTFDIANIPGDNAAIEARGGLAKVLYEAVTDPDLARLTIVYNGPKPDLLKDEAQAIITGHLDASGVFRADEILLKCPTKYQEAVPSQVVGN